MKAISLISGGLDSILASCLIKELGIEVIPLKFNIPFSCRAKALLDPSEELVRLALGLPLIEVDISIEFLRMMQNPRFGFGANLNPCIDCKILMLTKAKELLLEYNAQFVVTGEVLGQRPMSQHKQALEIIAKHSGLEGLVLRPLSARLLPITIPEEKGWVDRQKLLDFNGRTRKPQINLAKKYNIENYPNAAGGCLLTDPGFTQRLKELISHQELALENIELLKVGRHFRLAAKTKLVVGRNEKENAQLEKFFQGSDCLFLPSEKLAGPTALGRGFFNQELLELSCGIVARYCDLQPKAGADIIYRRLDTQKGFNVQPLGEEKLALLRI